MSSIADIAVPVNLFRTFHYRIPDELQGTLDEGTRVLVPFGSRRVVGTVVGFPKDAETRQLKAVLGTEGEPVTPALLKLGRWMADYYLHPLGLAIETMVSKAAASPAKRVRKLLRLSDGGGEVRGSKQKELLLLLRDRRTVPFDELKDFSAATIRTLCRNGMAEVEEQDVEEEAPRLPAPDAPPELMPAQAEAVARIGDAAAKKAFATFLLRGVTGSGKTEVYLRCIARLAGTGAGSIVLVPEIALTPQLLNRFRRRFGGRVAVLHSGLSDRERAGEHRRIREGRVDVVIGARSAVFAPFARLGLVVVDEEHETSYKQDDGLRYHARDVAVMRAKFENAVCLLGSATPSLESAHNAATGKYGSLVIADRVDHRPMPPVELVDLRAPGRKGPFSPRLADAVRACLARREQALLLLNRRGFSSVLFCADCGAVVKCPSCSVSLTYHKNDLTLKCHYCDHSAPPPSACPACGGVALVPVGTGTQRIEEEAAALFPGARAARMDSDSVKGRDAYEKLLGRVDRGEVDILLGTQMVAKGHDFPSVTLVGVLDADVGLNLPDFRAAERTFQLITQAAGRAGRGSAAGSVIVQTANPGHYALRHGSGHDYGGFYAEEMRFREELGYPPFRRMLKFELRSAQDRTAADAAAQVREVVRAGLPASGTTLLGPAPCPVSRVRGRYRYQLLLLTDRRELVKRLAMSARQAVEDRFGRKVQVIVDVDPVNLM